MKRHSAFTLIELLVSISIMIVILSLTFAGIGSARRRSRDAKRIADLRTIQSALEQHVLGDSSRSYPPDPSLDDTDSRVTGYCAGAGAAQKGIYDNRCFDKFLSATPLDPDGTQYMYARPACFVSDGTAIDLVHVESESACQARGGLAYSSSYGLHVKLETDTSPEAKNDATPSVTNSYDLVP